MMMYISTPLYEGYVNTDAINVIEVKRWSGGCVLGITIRGDYHKILTGSENVCVKCARDLASTINKGVDCWIVCAGGES